MRAAQLNERVSQRVNITLWNRWVVVKFKIDAREEILWTVSESSLNHVHFSEPNRYIMDCSSSGFFLFCFVFLFFSFYFFSAVCMCRFFPVLLHGNFHKHVSALFVLIAFFTFDAEGLCTRCYFFSTADLIETERFFFLVRWISCKNQRHLIQELEYSNQSQLSVHIFFVYNFRQTWNFGNGSVSVLVRRMNSVDLSQSLMADATGCNSNAI